MSQLKQCTSCKTDIDIQAKKCPQCHTDLRNWFVRHPIISLLLIIFIGIPVIAGIISDTKSTSKDQQSEKIAVSPEVLAQNNQELEILKKKFTFENDEFKNIGWYLHKDQSSQKRNLLRAYVQHDGTIYLESQYHGNDWVFHTKVQVRIGDQVLSSADIPTLTDNNKTDTTGDGVYEFVSYLNGKDNGIIKAIAESGDKEVKVRFEGRQNVKDITLSNQDKQAIKDSYRLSELLKITQ